MTRARFDYFRVTLKPEHELPNERDQYGKTPFEHCMSTLKNTLLLGDLIKKMVDCGRCLHYDRRFSYENISLKVPTEEHYSIQGVCLEFSAQGLDSSALCRLSEVRRLRGVRALYRVLRSCG